MKPKTKFWNHNQGPWRCWYCGARVWRLRPRNSPSKATIDHIYPISRGGVDDVWNYALACRFCNQTKADEEDWIILDPFEELREIIIERITGNRCHE